MKLLKNVALAAAVAVSVGFVGACASAVPPTTTTTESSTTVLRRAAGNDQQRHNHDSVPQGHRDEHHAPLFQRGNESISRDGSDDGTGASAGVASRRTNSSGSHGANPEPNNHFFELGKRGYRAEENYNICRRVRTEPNHVVVRGLTVSDHYDHDESILIKAV